MTGQEKKEKNKEGIANIITVIGICLIIVGIIVGFTDAPKNFGMSFFVCGGGTTLTFVGNYIKNGYIKFFN